MAPCLSFSLTPPPLSQAEIGVFFPLVILRTLDSPDIPLSHRTAVLRALAPLTSDAQLLADVFVNYDCDLASSNLFERCVASIERVAQTPMQLHSSHGMAGVPDGPQGTAALLALKQAALQVRKGGWGRGEGGKGAYLFVHAVPSMSTVLYTLS